MTKQPLQRVKGALPSQALAVPHDHGPAIPKPHVLIPKTTQNEITNGTKLTTQWANLNGVEPLDTLDWAERVRRGG